MSKGPTAKEKQKKAPAPMEKRPKSQPTWKRSDVTVGAREVADASFLYPFYIDSHAGATGAILREL
jgi:hypothetical protein